MRSPVPLFRAIGSFVRSMIVAFAVLLLVLVAISAVFRNHALLSPKAQVLDYRVLACAERVLVARGDIYRTSALRECEHRFAPETNEPAWSVTPFALPPYAAAILMPFGMLDFEQGRRFWLGFQIVSLCAVVAALARIIKRPALGVALVLVPVFGLLNILYGEAILPATAAAALGSLALQRGRPVIAAICVGAAMIDPAIGLPCAIGLFVLAPGARRTLLLCLAGLFVLSVGALGIAANVEYAFSFIPIHGQSELFARDQFSLSRIAFVLGADPRLASLLGTLCYAVTIGAGVVLARTAGGSKKQPALFILLPLAMSMLGGPFVHDDELTVALLAALILARDSVAARCSIALLSIVWDSGLHNNIVPAIAVASGVAVLYLDQQRMVLRVVYAGAVAIAVLALNAALPRSPQYSPVASGTPTPAIQGRDISSIPWSWRIRLTPAYSSVDLANELEKLPFWVALLCLPVSCITLPVFVRYGTRTRSPEPT